MASGGPLEGGLLLLCFGLGTLPNLLAMGLFAATLSRWVRYPWVRWTAGGLIILFGLSQIVQVWSNNIVAQ